MTYYEWIEMGVEAGYMQMPVCGMCEGTPMTEEEYEEGHCVPVARLLPPD